MVGNTVRLIWVDLLAIILRMAAWLVKVTTGERYAASVADARATAEIWQVQRLELVPSAKRLARTIGLWLFGLMVISMTLMIPMSDSLRAMVNTQADPILFAKLTMLWMAIGSAGLAVAMYNLEGPK